jgi:hypothetical protein
VKSRAAPLATVIPHPSTTRVMLRDAAAMAYGEALTRMYEARRLCEETDRRNIPGLMATACRLMRRANEEADRAFDELMRVSDFC